MLNKTSAQNRNIFRKLSQQKAKESRSLQTGFNVFIPYHQAQQLQTLFYKRNKFYSGGYATGFLQSSIWQVLGHQELIRSSAHIELSMKQME